MSELKSNGPWERNAALQESYLNLPSDGLEPTAGSYIRSRRAERRWKKRQVENERKRQDRERLAEIDARIHDWSDSEP